MPLINISTMSDLNPVNILRMTRIESIPRQGLYVDDLLKRLYLMEWTSKLVDGEVNGYGDKLRPASVLTQRHPQASHEYLRGHFSELTTEAYNSISIGRLLCFLNEQREGCNWHHADAGDSTNPFAHDLHAVHTFLIT